MSSAFFQSQNFAGAWFSAMVARPAKSNQICNLVGFGYAPRDDVMNVKPLPLASKGVLRSPTLATRVSVTRSNDLSDSLPICAALIVLGRSALPLRVFFTGLPDNLSRHVAAMRTKSTRIAVETSEVVSAAIARYNFGLFSTPPRTVIARHIAEASSLGVIGVSLECAPTSLARLFNPCLGFFALANARAIRSTLAAPKGFAAFCAGFFNAFHVCKILGKHSKNKYFDIACKRVEEAYRQPDLFVDQPKAAEPQQEGFDL